MLGAAACLMIGVSLGRHDAVNPERLLAEIHSQSRTQTTEERLTLLYDLGIAATAIRPATSAAWSMEMYKVATDASQSPGPEQMNRAANRKNALTILSLTNPELAARHFFELEPSPGHLPGEDPRIDLARNLFPRLWTKDGTASLPMILRMADFTGRDGQYPFVAIGSILPRIAKASPAAAHSIVLEAVRRRGEERGILRTANDYLEFVRLAWPAMSAEERKLAIEAGLAVLHRDAEDRSRAAPSSHTYAEYYLPEGSVRFNSDEISRAYDLLPYAEVVGAATLAAEIRRRYPDLENVALPSVGVKPWRSRVFATAEHDTPERVEAAFERHHLLFLREWAKEDATRAAVLARKTNDPRRRRTAIALILPAYAKVNPSQAEDWRQELMAFAQPAGNADDLSFLVAFVRANFALGHIDEAERATVTAMTSGLRLVSASDPAQPVYLADGATDLHDLAMTYGEFHRNNRSEFVRQCDDQQQTLRLYLLAGAIRGALRARSGYQEPI